MTLTLEIELDNIEMFNEGEIIACLSQVGTAIEEYENLLHSRTSIRDTNGNIVGWFVVE